MTGTAALLAFCWCSRVMVYGFILLPLCRSRVRTTWHYP